MIVGEVFPGIPVISEKNIAIQTPAFLMQDLANIAGKEKGYPVAGRLVAPRYTSAKLSFFATSGEVPGVKDLGIGGMAHPHLPQTYYLIARNNFVALP
ncbi:hypothetical protein [Pseudolactococcus carnosus]|uniref:hypothetical protein n=1 Tax=Pseudolactococcus carnosus TaxID=2749961 RepID=UPI00117B4A35|nr:hypothetical protein [Lactococcus carnosus]